MVWDPADCSATNCQSYMSGTRGEDGGSAPRNPGSGRSLYDAVFSELQMPNPAEQLRAGQIVLRPLERGFGHTLGNTMRRILLSSLRGAAVWAFRVDGMLHVHQRIPGVVEDAHEIIRNLKSLVLRMDDDADEAVLELRASKAGPVTARAITAHPSVDIINPDHHILELQDDRDLRLDLYVNKGRGYVPAEAHPIPRGMPADLVRVDAIYNPVTRANYVVEETRVGQRTDFDRLVLEVETNGALDVPSAVQYAARLAIEHLAFLAGGLPEGRADRQWREGVPAGRVPVPPRLQELLNRPIVDLTELSVRSRNSLQKEKIHTVRDLVQRTEQQMLSANLGKKSLREISDFLAGHGLRFGSPLEVDEAGTLWWVLLESELPAPVHEASPEALTVLVVRTGQMPLPVEVRDEHLRLVARGRTDQQFLVPPGRYIVVALLPGGESVEMVIKAIPPQSIVDFDSGGLLDGEAVDQNWTAPVPVLPRPSIRTAPTLQEIVSLGLTGFLSASVGYGVVGALSGASIGAALSRPRKFFIRTYQIDSRACLESPVSTPVEVLSRDEASLLVRFGTNGNAMVFVQVAVPGLIPLNVAVPAISTQPTTTCEILITQDERALYVSPRFGDPLVDLALVYWQSGDLRAAGDVLTDEDVVKLLENSAQRPAVAALGGYLLLRLDRQPRALWPLEVMRHAPALSDQLILAGEHAARAGDHLTASGLFLDAAGKGFPVFSEGLSLLSSRLRQYGQESPVDGLNLQRRQECAEFSRVYARWTPFVRNELALLAFPAATPRNPAETQVPFVPADLKDEWTQVQLLQ